MSTLDKYLANADAIAGYRRSLGRVSQLTGGGTALLGSESLAQYARDKGTPPRIPWGITTAAGVVAGGIIGMKYGHPFVAALSGGSIFTNTPYLLNPETRGEALWNLAQTHGGVIASLATKEKKVSTKALFFALGYLGVGIARLYGETTNA